jgi:hypothetical protein
MWLRDNAVPRISRLKTQASIGAASGAVHQITQHDLDTRKLQYTDRRLFKPEIPRILPRFRRPHA